MKWGGNLESESIKCQWGISLISQQTLMWPERAGNSIAFDGQYYVMLTVKILSVAHYIFDKL